MHLFWQQESREKSQGYTRSTIHSAWIALNSSQSSFINTLAKGLQNSPVRSARPTFIFFLIYEKIETKRGEVVYPKSHSKAVIFHKLVGQIFHSTNFVHLSKKDFFN